MAKDISLEQSLQAYRVMNTPTQYSWKKHWAQEEFECDNAMDLDPVDYKQFCKRLQECEVSIMPNITSREGVKSDLQGLVQTIVDPSNQKVADRKSVV